MKKILNYIFIFITIFALCGTFMVVDNKSVLAAEENIKEGCHPGTTEDFDFTKESNKTYTGCIETIYGTIDGGYSGEIGKVYISSKGQISVSYKYGISEFLVYASNGRRPHDGAEDAEELNDSNSTKIKNTIIFRTGAVVSQEDVTNGAMGVKTIHLFNYFSPNDRVTINIIVQFADSEDHAEYYNDEYEVDNAFFNYLYCNVDYNLEGCYKGSNRENKARMVSTRVNAFKKLRDVSNNAIVHYVDKDGIVYRGKGNLETIEDFQISSTMRADVEVYDEYIFGERNIKFRVDNSQIDGATKKIQELAYDTILPVLMGILGLAAVVTVSILGYQIVKSSDEAQDRAQKISNLKSVLIGVGLAFLLVLAIRIIIGITEGYIGK